MPTCRRDHWLRGALDSVLAQHLGDFEVIVSDSAGSDETRALVMDVRDARIRYRRNPRPVDALGNHAAAFAEARGRYVAFLHDDDVWEPSFLTRLVGALECNPDCVLAFCDQAIIDAAGMVSEREADAVSRQWGRDGLEPGTHKPFWHLVLMQSIPTVVGCVFRRTALHLEDFTPEAGPAFDVWLSYVLCRTGGGAYYVPSRLIRYRVHDTSETFRPGEARESTIWVWEQIVRDPGMHWLHEEAMARLARARQRTALLLLSFGCRGTAFQQGLRAYREAPSVRGMAVLALTLLPRLVVSALLRRHQRAAFRRGGISSESAPQRKGERAITDRASRGHTR